MKRTIITVTISVLITLVAILIIMEWQAQQKQLEADDIVELYSTILDEDRFVLVHLPDSYNRDPAQEYPVIYVLDATSQDVNMANTARILAAAEVMPEAIVIGILNTDRERDFTPPSIFQTEDQKVRGEADKFLSFIEEELVPSIAETYRTNGKTAIAGNSRGGLFVGYAVLENPELFDAYFSFSPAYWRDNHQIAFDAVQFANKRDSLSIFWYNSLGTAENDKMKRGYKAMEETITGQVPGMVTHFTWTPDAVHGNNAYYSMPEALSLWARQIQE